MFYTQHFKCPPDAHAKCLVLFLFGKIDAVEPFRLAAALKSAWVGAEVSRGQLGSHFANRVAGRLCLCLWRLFGGCRSHRNWTQQQKQAMSVAPGTMQPAVNAFDNVSRVGMVTIQFWLKGASLGDL